MGVEGPMGPEGPVGPVGPQGPAGSDGRNEALYAFSFAVQEIPSGGKVSFDQGAILSRNATALNFSAMDTIQLLEPGNYFVTTYLMPHSAGSTFALFVDEEEVYGSRYTAINSTNIPAQHLIVLEDVPKDLSLRNVGSRSELTQAGLLENTVTASILVDFFE